MQVAFIGLGTMGLSMARNILRAGFALTVYNRTPEKAALLAAEGAGRGDTPAAAAAGADAVIVCVSDTPDVKAVLLGETGVIHGAAAGTVVADMSTISPTATRDMAQQLAEKQIRMLDAPVSGGAEGARSGTLSIMVGGDAADLARIRPVFEAMGRTITHVGPAGAGQLAKAVNQTIICGTYLGVVEGLVLGLKAGLDMDRVVQAVAGGAAGSWTLSNRAGHIVGNDYPPGFRMRLHHKDLRIALDMARELGVALPVAALMEQIEAGLIGRGFGEEDLSAIARFVREQSGIQSC